MLLALLAALSAVLQHMREVEVPGDTAQTSGKAIARKLGARPASHD